MYALPTLALAYIIELDFLSLFGIGVNFATKKWYFAKNPTIEYEFGAGSGDPSFRVNASGSMSAETRGTAAKAKGTLLSEDRLLTAVKGTLARTRADERGVEPCVEIHLSVAG